jgi:pyrroline-5-carboxylate reductase
MLCVKPQDMKKVLKKYSQDISSDHLILSIAAGIQLAQIEKVVLTKRLFESK